MHRNHDQVLAEPRRFTLWQMLHDLAHGGINAFHQWNVHDGLPFSAAMPAHQHVVPTLTIGLRGAIRVRGRSDVDLLAGDILLIEPGCWHEHLPIQPDSAYFSMGFLAGKCDVLFFEGNDVLWGAVPEAPYLSWMRELMACTDLASGGMARRLSLIDEILAQVTIDRINFLQWESGVLAMAAHMWNHLHEGASANDIIARSRLGRTVSYDVFHKFFGRSPQQEILSQRMALANHLLHRHFSVTETARRCGFRDRAELTRAYRRHFGHPPRLELKYAADNRESAFCPPAQDES